MKSLSKHKVFISFLVSGISGLCLDTCVYSDASSIVAFLIFCFGLVPFFWFILNERKSIRLAAFVGFSLSVSLLIGEGLWSSLHGYYQVSFLPAILIFAGWVWLAGCLHWLVLSLFVKGFFCPSADFLWLFPFAWMSLEFIYGRISIQGQSVSLGLLGPLNALLKIFIRAGGVHAASFFYVFVNVFILALFQPNPIKTMSNKRWLFPLSFLLAMWLVDSFITRKDLPFDKPFRAGLLQPNLTIVRQEKSDQTTQQRLDKLIHMTQKALEKNVDLIVWPAAVMSIRDDIEVSYALKQLGGQVSSKTKILIGVLRTVTDAGKEKVQNTVYMANTLGQIENVYVKQKLTPYTEYIPCSFLDFTGRGRKGISPFLKSSQKGSVFESNAIKWANPICIEIYYPGLLRSFLKKEAGFLIDFSNDDAFKTARFKWFLVKLSALRAMELGMPILRESINGISAQINGDGEILEYLPSGQEGIIYATLTQKMQPTFYANFGDVFSYLSLLITVWGLWSVWRRKKC